MVTIGNTQGDRLTITPIGRVYPDAKGYWDANWLNAQIDIKVGPFSAKTSPTLRTDEFQAFLPQLEKIAVHPSGIAAYQHAEEWLKLEIRADGAENFFATGWLVDELDSPNLLNFKIKFARLQMQQTIRQINDLLTQFPVIAKP